MGLKDLFVQEVEQEEDFDLEQLSAGLENYQPEPEPQVEVADIEIKNDIVSETYEANGLTDTAKSILKVEELSATLPTEMPTASKRTTVLSIMQTVGLNADEAVEDGEARVEVLNATLEKEVDDLNSEINDLENNIEEMKQKIAEYEKFIADNKTKIKKSTEDVNNEVERIAGLIKFVKGE